MIIGQILKFTIILFLSFQYLHLHKVMDECFLWKHFKNYLQGIKLWLYAHYLSSYTGDGAAVLIRAIDDLQGIKTMRTLRGVRRSDKGERLKEHDLGNGPSKLTQAMAIDKANTDKADLTKAEHIWLEDGDEIAEKNVVVTSRIGVSSAGEEWAQKPLRFYVQGSKGISVRDKKAELVLLEMSETK